MALHRIVLLSSLLLVTTSAFSARKSSRLVRSSSSSSSVLHATSSSVLQAMSSSALQAGAVSMDEDENEGSVFLMSRATACADGSETCSLEEAQSYLEDVLLIQKDCLDETLALASTNSALCENVDRVVEVVANLRLKIEVERARIIPFRATVDFFNVVVGVYVVSTILHGFMAVPTVPLDVYSFSDRGISTILPQEWYWSVRDGYFPMLFSEWFKNGGLVVDLSMFDDKAVAFTPQEWYWAAQNGSLGNLMEENMRYGGFRVSSCFDTEGLTPMNAQDVFWSIQGGYLGTAAQHFFRNGGV